MSHRYCEDEVDEFKYRRDLEDAHAGRIVDAAISALERGDFDDQNVHEIMSRRSGTIEDYIAVKAKYEVAVEVALHTGAT